ANPIMGGAPSVLTGDVSFPNDPGGQADRVQVQVYRTAARSNAVPTLMGSLFGVQRVDITAVATAEASPANAMTCVKPFTIPDRWIEKQDPGGWNSETSTFDTADNKGRPLANGDVYIPADQPGYTGYNQERDRGTRLMIRAGTGNNIQPCFYFSYAMGGV